MRATRLRWSRRLSLALLIAVFAAAGCAEDSGASPVEPGPGNGGATGIPSQPFDILLGGEYNTVEQAHQQIRNRCLADAGYPQNLELFGLWRPPDPFEGLKVSARSYGPTSEDEARRLGFGMDSAGEPARIVSFDSGYDANLERCSTEAWVELGPQAQETMANYMDLFNLLGPYRLEVELPEDLPAKLYDCMVGKGYQTDREAFLSMPSYRNYDVQLGSLEHGKEEAWQPKNEPGTVQVGPPIPPRRYKPTAAEVDLAVAWFQCDQQVGWVQAQMAAAFAVQQRYVDRYEAQITELNAQLAALARTAAALASQG